MCSTPVPVQISHSRDKNGTGGACLRQLMEQSRSPLDSGIFYWCWLLESISSARSSGQGKLVQQQSSLFPFLSHTLSLSLSLSHISRSLICPQEQTSWPSLAQTKRTAALRAHILFLTRRCTRGWLNGDNEEAMLVPLAPIATVCSKGTCWGSARWCQA